MLKAILGSIALCVLFDFMAFGGFYSEHIFLQTVAMVHELAKLDWTF
jgi:hypothetical protein